MRIATVFLLVAATLVVGCKKSSSLSETPKPVKDFRLQKIQTQPITSVSLANGTGDQESPRFEKIAPQTIGIDFVNKWDPPEKYEVMIAHSSAGAGVTVGDIDNDGLTDIYFPRPFGGGRLYRNLGGFKFQDVTSQAGLGNDLGWGSGATFVDIDNDTDLDLYVCGFDCPNRLFINDGTGKFVDQAKKFGLDFKGASIMMSFADYDRDGDLDGLLVTNRHAVEGYQMSSSAESQAVAKRVRVVDGKAVFPNDLVEKYSLIVRGKDKARIIRAGQFCRLFKNNGNGFEQCAFEAGIKDNGISLAGTWWDYNQDNWPDLYLSNDFFGPDRLYRNNQDGTFSEVAGDVLPHTPWMSMGTDIGDINNDGRIDLFATDMSGTNHYRQKLGMGDMSASGWFLEMGRPRQYMRNAVYLNSGVERAMEVAHMLGVANSDWTWAPRLGDLDNDGDMDVFIANGVSGDWNNSDLSAKLGDLNIKEALSKIPPKFDANLAFENTEDLKFRDASKDWGLNELSRSYGATLVDLDNDGDLDILTNDFDAPPLVYRNKTVGESRIKLSLQGRVSNSFGVGALVELECDQQKQVRSLTLARGFMSAAEPVLHFGLGKSSNVSQLKVTWPSGICQTFKDLKVDRHYTIAEPDEKAQLNRVAEKLDPMFVEKDNKLRVPREFPFNDFERQPLLPNQLSALGPAMAAGDIDGDGWEDLFVSGPRGSLGRIYKNHRGSFEPWETSVLNEALECEDTAALFFDADGDSDLDLYVVSGGVECKPESKYLLDRLYINDGKGHFSVAPAGALPELKNSGGCVVAGDLDQDGDLDLFVGGRVVPGQYPRTPQSTILINESKPGEPKFVDQTAEVASSISQTGLVTSAIWSDVDGDDWVDLLVAHDWGPVKFFRNDQGELQDATQEAQLAQSTGWWNAIAGGDIDNDGDTDFVVGNFGLNTKYHVSSENPAIIYYHDFDTPGQFRIVEAHAEQELGKIVPVRGRSCSSSAMPFIAQQCETYHKFAISGLDDLYGSRGLDQALRVEANTVRSMVLINDGKGRFDLQPLPPMAQVSPSFGVALFDANADGNLDLFMAQNFFGPQRETGRMDGGLSVFMRGDGKGKFEPIEPAQSGVSIPGDAKSVVVTDFDQDGRPDIIVGINDESPVILQNNGQ